MIIKEIDSKLINTVHSELNKNGFIHLKKKIRPIYVSKFLKILKQIYKKGVNNKGLPERDTKDLRINNLAKRHKLFCDLISDNQIEKILIPILNDKYYRHLPDNLPNYILGGFNGRSSGNKLDLHIDSCIPFKSDYKNAILILFILEEMHKDNGATIVVPKSHNSGTFTNRKTKKYKIINGQPGDILIMDARTWHGTTENLSNKSRWVITSVFYAWWMKQQVDFTRSIPTNIFNKLTNKQKQLLGFCSIPPVSEKDRINIKCGYEILKKIKI